MFIDVDSRLRRALAETLSSGEQVRAAAFGLHTVSRTTARWILACGLYLAGLILLGMLNDKVFVVVTDRRCLILRLTFRGLTLTDVIELPVFSISRVEHHKGRLFHELQFASGEKTFRFTLSDYVIGFPDNGLRVQQLVQHLSAAVRPDVLYQAARCAVRTADFAHRPVSAAPAASRKRRRFRLLVLSSILAAPLLALLGPVAVVIGVGLVGGMRSESLRQQALHARSHGNYEQAGVKYEQAIAAVGRWSKPKLYCELAEMWSKQGQYRKACQTYRQGIEESAGPDLSLLYHGLILAQAASGECNDARATHRRSQELETPVAFKPHQIRDIHAALNSRDKIAVKSAVRRASRFSAEK